MADRLLANAPAPVKVPVIDQKTGLLTPNWADYFNRLTATLDAIPSRLNNVSLSGQTGNIGATDFSNGVLLVGQYRLTYYVRVASSGGGSIQITFRWTDGGVACSMEGLTLTLGSSDLSATLSETCLARIDAGSQVTFESSFSGGSSYNLDVTLERVAAL